MRKIDNSCKLVVNKLFALVSILLLASSFNAFADDDDDDGVMYGEPVFTETFGQGWGVWGSFEEAGLSPLAKASYTYYGKDNLAQSSSVRGNNNSSCWQFDYFDCTITNSIDFLRSIYPNAHNSWLLANFRDHTGDYDGRMFVADGAQRPGSVFERTVTELCKNAKFEFSAWVAFIHNNNNNPPNFQLEIWTKNPNLGLEAAMNKMSDYQKAQFMGKLTTGNKFASSEGGSAELLADGKPTDDNKRKGWRCLAGVIKVLKPTSVLIIGVRNDGGSDSINDDSLKLENFKDDKENKINRCAPRIGYILSSQTIIPITLIHHTSQGYSPDKWREYLKKRDPQMMAYLSR